VTEGVGDFPRKRGSGNFPDKQNRRVRGSLVSDKRAAV